MKIGAVRLFRRSVSVAAATVLIAALAACAGRGGGYLPPNAPLGFTSPASFGFTFSCERSSRSTRPNPPAGQLRIQLAYTDHGANPIGSWFSIHGTVDPIDPVLESMICIGQNPPPEPGPPNELIFLGRYRLTSAAPEDFPSACLSRETRPHLLCRFEVIVRDNDQNYVPSKGDFFQIRLSSAAVLDDELLEADVFYTRAGLLQGGNINVD